MRRVDMTSHAPREDFLETTYEVTGLDTPQASCVSGFPFMQFAVGLESKKGEGLEERYVIANVSNVGKTLDQVARNPRRKMNNRKFSHVFFWSTIGRLRRWIMCKNGANTALAFHCTGDTLGAKKRAKNMDIGVIVHKSADWRFYKFSRWSYYNTGEMHLLYGLYELKYMHHIACSQ